MLVLSRQRDEELVMEVSPEELIVVTVVDIRGDKVRLGTTAPKHIGVHRREVYNEIVRERRTGKRTPAELAEPCVPPDKVRSLLELRRESLKRFEPYASRISSLATGRAGIDPSDGFLLRALAAYVDGDLATFATTGGVV